MAKSQEALVDVTEVIRRVLRSRSGDAHLVEDLTQETLVHVAAARPRLTDDTLRAYAIVTARNTLFRHFRRQATARRRAHRLVDYRSLDGPEQLSLEREETDALAVALDQLEPDDRELLLAHEVNDEPLDALAEQRHTSTRAIGMRLPRARAQLRVEFIVAFRHVGPLPIRCRNVLIAMSAGDTRRQRELGAAEHVTSCDTCASLSEPIVQRRRGIAGWIIVPMADAIRRAAHKLRASRTTQVAAAVAAVAAVVAGVAYANHRNHGTEAVPAPPPTTALSTPSTARAVPVTTVGALDPVTTTTVDGCAAAAALSTIDTSVAGCPFTVANVSVVGVPADEGFWITAPDGQAAWVHLVGDGESTVDVDAGQQLTMSGVERPVVADIATMGLPSDQISNLGTRTAYLEVAFEAVTVTG